MPADAALWQTLSRKVISSVLVDVGAILAVQDKLGQHSEWHPPKERVIWRGIQACLEANVPPTTVAVQQRTNGKLPDGYIQSIANQFNEQDNEQLKYHAEQLAAIGMLAAVRAQGKIMAELDDPDRVVEVVNKSTTELGGLLAERSNRDARAKSVSDAAWEDIQPGSSGVKTGLAWLDKLTGGMRYGMNWWLVAAYKSGKSTLMRNIILNAAQAGHPVGMFCAEGSREAFSIDCQAMLATEIMIRERGIGCTKRLSGFFIWEHYWNEGVMKPHELDAINRAKKIWEKLPITTWDVRDGITDLVTLRYLVKMQKLKTKTRIFWGDHSLLFGSQTKDYDRQSTTAKTIQNIALNEGVVMGMVAQQNEDHIRKGNRGKSPGVKGGGDAAAAADVLIIPGLAEDDEGVPEVIEHEAGVMKVNLKLARQARSGGKMNHPIDPASGLLLDRWLNVQSDY